MTTIKINNRKDFLKLINSSFKLIPTKATVPIIEMFKFETDINSLKVTATDLENTLIRSMVVECETSDSFCVPANDFKDAISLLTCDSFEIKADSVKGSLVIDYGNGSFEMGCADADSYPTITLDENTQNLTIYSQELYSNIGMAKAFVADDSLRPVMNGIYFYIENKKYGVCSTDSHRLYHKEIDSEIETDCNFIANAKGSSILYDIINGTLSVDVILSEKNVTYIMDGCTLICRLIEGKYPNFRAVIPQSHSIECKINKDQFVDAIKRANWGANMATKLTKMSIKDNKLSLVGQDLDFAKNVSETINCECNSGIEIGFKSVFMLEILANITTENVVLKMNDASKPIIILSEGDESTRMLLMPMMIN